MVGEDKEERNQTQALLDQKSTGKKVKAARFQVKNLFSRYNVLEDFVSHCYHKVGITN